MSKRFSTLDTTRLFFEHPKILFRLLERMDRSGVRFVREDELILDVLDYTKALNNADRERLLIAFAPENLFRTGLVIDIVKSEGERRLIFQGALLDLMRACNASLYQELTDAKLRAHLIMLRDVRASLEVSSFNSADPDFTELTEELTNQVSELIGLLRQNVLRMQIISSQLSDMSGEASREPEKFAEFRQNLFENIVTLYDRHIKPTLIFLNPDTRLPDGSNLFEALDELVKLLEYHEHFDIADQLSRSSLSLNALHKPIQMVGREVEHFLRKTRRGMVQYNAMEHHFSVLRKLKTETETLNLRKKWLNGSEFARTTGFLMGLRAHSRPKHYAFGTSSSYHQLLFSELAMRLNDLKRKLDVPALQDLQSSRERGIDIHRINTLYQWLETLELRPTPDLVRELHGRLDGFIEGYRFPDLLGALNRLVNATPPGFRVVTTNRLKVLEPTGKFENPDERFVYRKRRLELLNEYDGGEND